MLDLSEGSPGIVNLFVHDLFGKGGTEMKQRVLARLTRKHFQVDTEERNDVLFEEHRIRRTKGPQLGPCIEVSHERAIEELEEIPVEMKTKDFHCTRAMHATEAF